MKKRIGFVSNSSVSSFICDVCGAEIAGQDIGLSDYGWVTCINDHTLCDSCQITCECENENEDDEVYEVAECHCPVCQLKAITDYDLINYLFKKHGISRESVLSEVKTRYGNYKAFSADNRPKPVEQKPTECRPIPPQDEF